MQRTLVTAFLLSIIACTGDSKYPRDIVGRWERLSYGQPTGQYIEFRPDGTTTFLGYEKKWFAKRDSSNGERYVCLEGDSNCFSVTRKRDTLEYGFVTLLRAK
jgi:hypothetical protein